MCGITGKLIHDRRTVDSESIRRMNRTLTHRGPDDEGVQTGRHFGFGQRRLSIIDLSDAATAPLANEDGSVWVTFNGEIYNHESLRNRLVDSGHEFRTRTDTEVLVHLWEELGVELVDELRGMFALAIWDERKRRFFAARDRFGQKPFYYSQATGDLLFASELKALLTNPDVPRRPNHRALELYLSYQYVPAPLTAFEGIQKLRPGHTLEWSPGTEPTTSAYWSTRPQSAGTVESVENLKRRIREKYREAVELRMMSDVPLGALLSGGIDSGATVAMMAEASSTPIKTFTIGLANAPELNESPYAKKVADRYGTEHRNLVVEPDAADVLPDLIEHFDEPFGDFSALPTYYVSKLAGEHVTVGLGGDGGDELFAGYNRYKRMMKWNAARWIPSVARHHVFGSAEDCLSGLSYTDTVAKIRKGLRALAEDLPRRYCEYRQIFKLPEREQLLTPRFSRIAGDGTDLLVDAIPYEPNVDPVDWMMAHDRAFYLPNDLNTKVDMMSMSQSLEVRAPFQDHVFAEFAASIPVRCKISTTRQKSILRDAFRPLLPEEVYQKPKTGFTLPLAEWLRDELSGLVRATLLDDRARRRDLFRMPFIERMVNQHLEARRNWTHPLWLLMVLEWWFRAYID